MAYYADNRIRSTYKEVPLISTTSEFVEPTTPTKGKKYNSFTEVHACTHNTHLYLTRKLTYMYTRKWVFAVVTNTLIAS